MTDSLDLSGTWKLSWSDGRRKRPVHAEQEITDERKYIDALVPGEIHMDAFRQGWIPDPYTGSGCLSARWIEECIWSYRRFFDSPAGAAGSRAWLVFESLDLAATIVLNGTKVGEHSNVFYPCRIDVTGKLKPGRNLLTVHVESGLFMAGDKPSEGYRESADQRLHKRHWLRKPQCSFSWDWSTRLINVGITGPVRLEWATDFARVDRLVPLAGLSPDLKKGTLRGRLFVEGLSSETRRATLVMELPETGARTEKEVEIKPGNGFVESCLEVDSPELWWPVGHGPRHLYRVKVSLLENGKAIAEKETRIGFRHVRVNQDTHPVEGRYFIIEINGRRIFCRGANFVPADMIFQRIDRERYRKLVDRALEANFNMLRVWGGGLYEGDDFYQICDEEGILVWQEFIFACGKYPVQDEAFHEDIKREARYQVRRLAEHPSLIVWCGNNEMEQGNWSWGYDRGVVYPDYSFFHLTLRRIMAEEDPTRYYQPSSPFSPDFAEPNADLTGDQHPWSIGFHNTDFRGYREMVCRFPNEGGTMGPNSLPTVKAALAGDERIGGFTWQIHDNSIVNWSDPSDSDAMFVQFLGKDIREMTLEDYVYWGGLLQGEAFREYIDNFRRRMFDSASAIFWMYNDCWPTVRSWTIVDYYLRRTPSFHPVRRAFAPLSVVLANEDGKINIYGINETLSPVEGELRYGIFKIAGSYPVDLKTKVILAPNASTKLASFNASEWRDTLDSAAFALFLKDGALLARNRLFLPFFKDLKWVPAEASIKLDKGRAVFESRTFAFNVCLDLDGEKKLADNYFDIYPGIPYSVPWEETDPPRILRIGNLS